MAKKEHWKCQHCGISDTHEKDMEFEMVGEKKPLKKRYHKDCYIKHLKDKKFKAEEQVKKDALNEVLKEIYGVKDFPNTVWSLLEHLRNGEPVFGAKQNIGKRYKEGYDYLLIKETFEHCSDTIERYNSIKNFDGVISAFKYALTIIIDKIYFVEQRAKQREKEDILIKKHLEDITQNEDSNVFDSSYKKKDNKKLDILDFLDD